jgi:hypothetical protein
MEEKNKTVISSILATILLTTALIFIDSKFGSLLLGSFIGLSTAIFINIGSWLLGARKNLSTIIRACFVCRLRLSCSYLYRIKVDDYFLLIKSRKHDKFQPVGGNFKKNKYSHLFLKEIEIDEDDKIQNGERTSDDLRLYIHGQQFSRFLNWYNSPKREREISYDREFYEELVEPGILPGRLFCYPIVDFRKQVISRVTYSTYFDCKEIHIYDIVELIPTPNQLNSLRELKAKGDTELIKWATQDTIRREGNQGVEKGTPYPITDHSRIMTDLKIT